jgi:hypothetical protein
MIVSKIAKKKNQEIFKELYGEKSEALFHRLFSKRGFSNDATYLLQRVMTRSDAKALGFASSLTKDSVELHNSLRDYRASVYMILFPDGEVFIDTTMGESVEAKVYQLKKSVSFRDKNKSLCTAIKLLRFYNGNGLIIMLDNTYDLASAYVAKSYLINTLNFYTKKLVNENTPILRYGSEAHRQALIGTERGLSSNKVINRQTGIPIFTLETLINLEGYKDRFKEPMSYKDDNNNNVLIEETDNQGLLLYYYAVFADEEA